MGEEAVGFNYLDENVWARYAEEVLLPVYANASAILDAWRNARERLNGKKLSELWGTRGSRGSAGRGEGGRLPPQ